MKEYVVVIKIKTDENPATWDWEALLATDPEEEITLIACAKI